MSNKNETHTGTLLVGFLVGGLAGATTALLLAPQAGDETRKQIHQKARELQGKAEGALNEAAAKVETVAADIKQRAVELQTQAHVVLEEGQKQIAKAMEETKKAATATLDSAVEKPKEIPAKA